MIVARGLPLEGDDRSLVIFGISEENVRRLKMGQPIDVPRSSLEAVGLGDKRVLIMYGKTLEHIERKLGVNATVPPGASKS